MVGGSTHMPMTGRMLAELSGKEPDHSLAVSEVVARGAAVHAGIVAARGGAADVTPPAATDAGRRGRDQRQRPQPGRRGAQGRRSGSTTCSSPKNTQLPAAASRVYYTVGRQPVAGAGEGAAGRGPPGGGVHPGRRVLDRGAAAEPAEGVAGAGAVRRRGQRADRGDGPGHDQRPRGDRRDPPPRRPDRRRDSPAKPTGSGP